MRMTADSIAIVIPAYNEASTIADVVRRAQPQASRVIVVDDGSVDDTAGQLAGMDVQVIRHSTNQGKALSLWNGMRAARSQGVVAVVTLDGDGQHSPEDIPRLLAAASSNPDSLVIASRLRRQESAPAIRLFANRAANFWISWAAGYRIADSQSGFRLYPLHVLDRIAPPRGRASSFVFESHVLIEAAWLGARSVPVTIDSVYFPAARRSHYRPALDTLRIASMIAGRLLRRGMHPAGLWRVIRDAPLPLARQP